MFTEDYVRFYNLIYKDKNYKQEAEFVYKWANKPKTMLELGIGSGQHAKYWAKSAKIMGIDKSQDMIENAYRHKNITYINQDIFNFLYNWAQENSPIPVTFDCITAMFNVMGYTLLEEIIPLLPLEKGQYFIFDIWDAAKFDKQPPQPKVKYFEHFYRISIPERISERLLRIDFIIVEIDQIRAFERHFVQGYFLKDIENLCRKYNYKIVDTKSTSSWQLWFKLRKI